MQHAGSYWCTVGELALPPAAQVDQQKSRNYFNEARVIYVSAMRAGSGAPCCVARWSLLTQGRRPSPQITCCYQEISFRSPCKSFMQACS